MSNLTPNSDVVLKFKLGSPVAVFPIQVLLLFCGTVLVASTVVRFLLIYEDESGVSVLWRLFLVVGCVYTRPYSYTF